MQNFYSIQAMRGFAAVWVVLFHCSEGNHIQALKLALPPLLVSSVFDAGHFGVAIFFPLSGFVIARTIEDGAVDTKYFWRFLLRRSVRLDPPYWASILFAIALAALSAHVVGKSHSFPTFWQVTAHVLYLQELLHYPAIQTVYWTLTFEVQFYLFFIASCLVISNGKWRMLILTIAAVFSTMDVVRIPGLFLTFWCTFYIGTLASSNARSEHINTIAFVLLAITMILTGLITHNTFVIISAIAAIFIYIVTGNTRCDQSFNWGPLQLFGKISYSLYLIHNPVTGASFYMTTKLLGQNLISDIVGLLVAILACLGISFLFWLSVEKPSHRLARRLSTTMH